MVFTILQFTGYRCYGEKARSKALSAGLKNEIEALLHLFRLYRLHDSSKKKKENGCPMSSNLQWKVRGGLFTEKKQKKVNNQKEKAENNALSS